MDKNFEKQILEAVRASLPGAQHEVLQTLFTEHAELTAAVERLTERVESLTKDNERLSTTNGELNTVLSTVNAENSEYKKRQEKWEDIEKRWEILNAQKDAECAKAQAQSAMNVVAMAFKSDVYRHTVMGSRTIKNAHGCHDMMPFSHETTDAIDMHVEHQHLVSPGSPFTEKPQ